jgi:hypothetical protein
VAATRAPRAVLIRMDPVATMALRPAPRSAASRGPALRLAALPRAEIPAAVRVAAAVAHPTLAAIRVDSLSQVHSSFIPRAPIISGPLVFFCAHLFRASLKISRLTNESQDLIFLP